MSDILNKILDVKADEVAAAKYPYRHDFETRGNDRMLDGTIVRP